MVHNSYDPVKAQALAQVASAIGAIPGCYLSEISKVSERVNGLGRTHFILSVMGRGPALFASEMSWGKALDLRLYPDADSLAAALLAAFAARMERQRQRAQEAIEEFGHPIPTNRASNEYRHIAVDRMSIWAIRRTTLKSVKREDLGSFALALHVRGAVERTLKNIGKKFPRDNGGARIGQSEDLSIREIKLQNGVIARQVGFSIVYEPHLIITGPSVIFENVSLPQTIVSAAPGRMLGEVFDLASGFGPDFAARFAMRKILKIDHYNKGSVVDLEPDLVRVGDVSASRVESFEGAD